MLRTIHNKTKQAILRLFKDAFIAMQYIISNNKQTFKYKQVNKQISMLINRLVNIDATYRSKQGNIQVNKQIM